MEAQLRCTWTPASPTHCSRQVFLVLGQGPLDGGGQSQSQIQRPLLHMVESFKSPRLLTRVRNTFPHLFSRDRGVLPGCCKVALKGSSTESQMIFLRPNRRPEPQTQQSTNGVPGLGLRVGNFRGLFRAEGWSPAGGPFMVETLWQAAGVSCRLFGAGNFRVLSRAEGWKPRGGCLGLKLVWPACLLAEQLGDADLA